MQLLSVPCFLIGSYFLKMYFIFSYVCVCFEEECEPCKHVLALQPRLALNLFFRLLSVTKKMEAQPGSYDLVSTKQKQKKRKWVQ